MICVLGWDIHPFSRECGLVKNDNKVLVNVDENTSPRGDTRAEYPESDESSESAESNKSAENSNSEYYSTNCF